nr:hypothetical protein [Tanacetum cinerariifolium]
EYELFTQELEASFGWVMNKDRSIEYLQELVQRDEEMVQRLQAMEWEAGSLGGNSVRIGATSDELLSFSDVFLATNVAREKVMFSLNHPTFDIEDAFSSNFSDYILASPDYVLALTRNTFSESLNNLFALVPIVSPTLLLFNDDPYMNVMHAYDDIIPPQVHIPSPIIVPPCPMLSPMFNPQEFFFPEKRLPPKKRGHERSFSSTSALPQAFEIRKVLIRQVWNVTRNKLRKFRII